MFLTVLKDASCFGKSNGQTPTYLCLSWTAYAELNDAVNLVAHEGAFLFILRKPIQGGCA